MAAPVPPSDRARVECLRALLVLDSPPERAFDDLTRLAALVCAAPIALVSLIDAERQWFKSRVGFDMTETSREFALCGYTILQTDLLEVPDTLDDDRFRTHPAVTGDPHARFYAGMPLTMPDGHAVGTLCVVDRVPRALTADQRDALRTLGRQVVAQLLLRQQYETTEFELREQETFRVLYERSSDAQFIFDQDRVLDCNLAAAAALRARDKSDVLNLPSAALAPDCQPDGRPSAERYAVMSATAWLAGGARFDWTCRRFDGQEFPCEVTLTPIELHGRPALLAVWHDLTERKRVEDALRESEQRFRGVVDELAEGVVLLDLDSRTVVEANPAFLKLLGYTSREVLALSQYAFVAHDPDDVDEKMARIVERGRDHVGVRKFRRKDGSTVDVSVSGNALTLNGRAALCLVVRDVSDQVRHAEQLREYQGNLERANARLRALAVTDALTGLHNRGAFDAKLADEFDRAARHGHPLSVILMDVDHFKPFNDTFGHPAGDAVLKAVADVLRRAARTTDLVARYGGEEFVLVLPDTDRAGAVAMAERCRGAVAAEAWDRRAITVSVGVSTRTPETADADELLQEADVALYRSKQAGRNRVSHNSGLVPLAPPARV